MEFLRYIYDIIAIQDREIWIAYVKIPENNFHGANMGPIWVLSSPDGPHIGPMNLAIRDVNLFMLDFHRSPDQLKHRGLLRRNLRSLPQLPVVIFV